MANLMNFDARVREVFENDSAKLLAFNKLMLDTYNGTLEADITIKEANEQIRAMFNKIIGVGENATKADIRKAIKRNQQVLFDLIEEVVPNLLQTGWQDNPFFNEFVETRNLDIGDQAMFYSEDETLLTVSKVSGNHHNMIRQRLGAGRHFAVTTEWFGLKIYSDFERVLTGAEDWASFVAKVADAVNRYIFDAVYAAMRGAQANLGSNWVKSFAIDAANKQTLVKMCQDISMATGSEVVLFGTRTVLSSLSAMADVNWAPESIKEEYYRNGGVLGNWEGFRVAEIGQGLKRGASITSASVEYQMDSDKLFIIPVSVANKFIKVVNEGDSQISQVTDKDTNRDMSYEYEMQFKMGISVILNTVFGVVDII